MSQLFTIYFPRYRFLPQNTFKISFNPRNIPFLISRDINGLYVSKIISELSHPKLKNGLKIIGINNKYIFNENSSIIEFNNKLIEFENNKLIDIYFIDNEKTLIKYDNELIKNLKINNIDCSSILNNEYSVLNVKFKYIKVNKNIINSNESIDNINKNNKTSIHNIYSNGNNIHNNNNNNNNNNNKIHINSNTEMKIDNNINNNNNNNDNMNSDNNDEFIYIQHNDNKYWCPDTINIKNIYKHWIRFCFNEVKTICKIKIIGDFDNNEYVNSFYIDYSLNNCEYTCHSMGLIECNKKVNEIVIWPIIRAKYIKIRPNSFINNIRIKIELYGYIDYEYSYLIKKNKKLDELMSLKRMRNIKYNNISKTYKTNIGYSIFLIPLFFFYVALLLKTCFAVFYCF